MNRVQRNKWLLSKIDSEQNQSSVTESSLDTPSIRNNNNLLNNAIKKVKPKNEAVEFVNNSRRFLLESALTTLFEMSLGERAQFLPQDSKNFHSKLISSFVEQEGVDNLFNTMRSKTRFLAETAYSIDTIIKEAMDEAGEDGTPILDKDSADKIFETISGDEDIEEIAAAIKFRVSRAVEEFMERNANEKNDIREIYRSAKERIESIRTGSDETDELAKQESANIVRKQIKKLSTAPKGVFESMVHNLSSAIIKNTALLEQYSDDNSKLDVGAVVEKCISYYTLLEMVSTINLVPVTEEYILEAIKMQ